VLLTFLILRKSIDFWWENQNKAKNTSNTEEESKTSESQVQSFETQWNVI
jgi:hypothetical protein